MQMDRVNLLIFPAAEQNDVLWLVHRWMKSVHNLVWLVSATMADLFAQLKPLFNNLLIFNAKK